jgi:drug/metabolite transporter (DMT)-like permease
MWQNAIGLACYIPWFAASDLVPVLTKGIPVAYIDNLLLLGILGSTVAYLLFIYSVQAITIWLVNAFANLIPVLTAFFAYLVLGEKLLPVGMAGVAVAMLGLFISQIKTKSAAPITENY